MKRFKNFLKEEDGMGVIEVVLIIVEKYFISYSL
ncbi:Putative Flagellin, Flp1-like, domain [Lachnospira multipara]|uniref:Putative Flagellin, Flp1-like, domain n=1 Tax=Lachnospira multipara TaxID=28051 RepID=A0A1H5U234_9FIRM|nr:Putative Flagellin, Flp1-like, domain [Lachnospira multipara]